MKMRKKLNKQKFTEMFLFFYKTNEPNDCGNGFFFLHGGGGLFEVIDDMTLWGSS